MSSKKKLGENNFEKEFIEAQKEILISEKEKILNEEAPEIAEMRGGKLKPRWEEMGYHEDESAAEVITYERNVSLNLAERQRLEDIDRALKKIDEGTYGICEICAKPIEKERLEAYPAARTHVGCRR